MQAGIKKWIFYICVVMLTIACVNIGYDVISQALEPTNRNEIYSPNEYNISVSDQVGYTKIYENNNFEYYYSSSKTIFKFVNKKSGFVWSTGADTDKRADVIKNCSQVAKNSKEYYACAVDIGTTRNGFENETSYAEINGLIYFTLIKGETLSNIWGNTSNATVGLFGHERYANEWMIKMSYRIENKNAGSGSTNSSSNSDSSTTSGDTSEELSNSDNISNASSDLSSAIDSSENADNSENSDNSTSGENNSSSESAGAEIEIPSTFEIFINMRLTFTENGFDLNIYNEDITGSTRHFIESIYPFPLLGQSGGKIIKCKIDNYDENGYGACDFSDTSTITDNPNTNLDGYIFVPDGSGALIRFDNVKYYPNSSRGIYFDMYKDPYKETYNSQEFEHNNYITEPDYFQTKHISMPVWGVAYGNNQDAFVAYVTKGSEYFGLLYNGRTTNREFASIRPRFERNRKYVYRYAGRATKYVLSADEMFYYDYDIGVSYNFLQGDGNDGAYPANYVGMALKYRSYLQENNLIKKDVEIKRGPKVDFLMSDTKEGIFGYTEVDVTTTHDVVRMLNDLHNDGISNIHSSLIGWQTGGNSKGVPWKINWNKKLGGKSGFENIVKTADGYGYHIDFYQQYAMLSEAQTKSFNAYAVKGLSRDYGTLVLADKNKPLTWWYYTNADVAGEWINKQAKEIAKLGDNVGLSTGGVTTNLVPDYGKKLSYLGAANAMYQATKDASQKLPLSGDTPNSYLWKNYDSFTNISVYNSQLQCETDSVPFMEIVFGGIINMYAEYANFSFYDRLSQMKLIEYNLNPSFIISAAENTDIMYTNARDWFATAYTNFHEIINEICDFVMPKLELIQGKTIVKREVVEDVGTLGLYVNTYASFDNGIIGDDQTVLAINYLNYDVTYNYNGTIYTIPAMNVMELK